jgi:hypothetical protein
MGDLKAIRRICLPKQRVLLDLVECKIHCTSMCPIKGLYVITPNN